MLIYLDLWVLSVDPSLCARTFAMFDCFYVDLQTSFLRDDFAISCQSWHYFVHYCWAIVFVCLYALGIPLVLGFAIFRQRGAIKQGRGPSELEALYRDYKPPHCMVSKSLIVASVEL